MQTYIFTLYLNYQPPGRQKENVLYSVSREHCQGSFRKKEALAPYISETNNNLEPFSATKVFILA
jgi:hypothetical protein